MKWKVLTLVLERFWLQIYYKSENESAPWGKHHHIFFKNCVLYPIHTSEGTFFTKIFDRSLVLTKIQQVQMFSVLVMLEDSENVWSDHLRQKMANPAAKNRFFHFRHAVKRGPGHLASKELFARSNQLWQLRVRLISCFNPSYCYEQLRRRFWIIIDVKETFHFPLKRHTISSQQIFWQIMANFCSNRLFGEF